MMNVKEDIKYLIQLVKKDMAIKRKMNVLDKNPEKIEEIDRKLREMDRQVEEKKAELDSLEREKRHLKSVIDSENDKIRQKKIEERRIESNAAYRAWEHELAYLKKNLDKHEEKMLVDLEETDRLKEELNRLSGDIGKKKNDLLQKKEQLEREMQRSREELEVIRDEKVRVMPHISEGVRNQYRRVLRAKGDSGVANLRDEICQGCFSKVPPQISHEVRKNDRIIRCENCGRILVYYEPDQED